MNTIAEADRKSSALIEKENRVLEAERGLRRLEAEANQQLQEALDMKSTLVVSSIAARRDQERITVWKKRVEAERFQLHTAAMEMSRQIEAVRQALSQVMRQQRVISIIDSGSQLSTNSQRLRYGNFNDDVPIDPIYTNIMYTLNAAAMALGSIAQKLFDPQSPEPSPSLQVTFSQPSEPTNNISWDRGAKESLQSVNTKEFHYSDPQEQESLTETLDSIRAKDLAVSYVGIENILNEVSESASAVKAAAVRFGVLD